MTGTAALAPAVPPDRAPARGESPAGWAQATKRMAPNGAVVANRIMAGYLSRMLRPASLAGQWYPDDERECRAAIERHAADTRPEQGPWRGLIGPHAGWTYSGDLAAQSFRWLAEAQPDATAIDLVVLFGAHRGAHGPSTILEADGWDSPLGPVPIAGDLAEQIAAAAGLEEEPVEPLHPDNAAELHVPFVRYFFPSAELLMLGVEESPRAMEIGKTVAEVVRNGARNAVYVGSTDLTHYGPNYRFEPHGTGEHAVRWVREENDAGFIALVLAREPEAALTHAAANHSACCAGAVAACMAAVGTPNEPMLVGHTLSYDVRPSSSFVGYAGIVL